MNAQDLEIMRAIRRELAKHLIDTTRLDIQVNVGRVVLGGIITNLRDHPTVDLKDEVSILDRRLSRDRLIREYTNHARLLQGDAHAKEEGTARGRMRHT